VIPAKGAIRVALAEDRRAQNKQMSFVEGFDLSPFNRLAPPCYQFSEHKERAVLRSEPADLFRFDFRSGGPFPEARGTVVLSTSGGLVNGIAQWIYLEIDEELRHEFPVEKNSALGTTFYPLMRPIEMAPGDTLTVCGSHDRQSIRIWGEIGEME
jgi:hypothetical protein